MKPGRELHGAGWHLDAIADHLEAVHRGQIKKLIINIPPRSLKSTLASVCFPAWEWLQDPTRQFLTSSFRLQLAQRDALHSRRLMQRKEYQRLVSKDVDGNPVWRFTTDQNVKTYYENDQGGHRICTSYDAGATGEGGDRVMCDDPHNVKHVDSDQIRQEQIDWWNETMSTRLNDKNRGARIVICQRTHELDLCADLLNQGGWDHLMLPTLFESDHPHLSKTSLHFVDPRTEDGEMLCPDHLDEDGIAEEMLSLGTYGFAAQHQQRPRPASGGFFSEEHFPIWTEETLPIFDRVLQSWDLTGGGAKGHAAQVREEIDPSSRAHGGVFGIRGADVYLLDEDHGRRSIVESIASIKAVSTRWPEATKKLIEAKAIGPAVVAILHSEVPGLIEVLPQGSKIERARACQPLVEAGNVWVPDKHAKPWVKAWLDEVCGFPLARRNDRVDTLTQVLISEQISETAEALRRARRMVKE